MAKGSSSTSAGTGAATDGVTRVEIVTRREARRSYTPEEKARLLTEAAEPGGRGAEGAAAGLPARAGGRGRRAGRPGAAGEAPGAGRHGRSRRGGAAERP